MKFWIVLICFAAAVITGFNTGKKSIQEEFGDGTTDSLIEFPMTGRKTFVFVVYAYNQAEWVERTLRSIFEQEYDYYRIVFIDDGSKDNTFAIAKSFIVENNQEGRTLLIHNEEKLGQAPCLYQAISGLLDQEIAIPVTAKDWLSHSGVLTRINAVFQNPDIWIASTSGIAFPSYEKISSGFESFYAALFKQLQLSSLELAEKNKKGKPFYLDALKELAHGRSRKVPDILFVSNNTAL